jgi:glutathione S-transferase
MHLYYSEASPYARKVRMLLHELNLECQLISINPLEQSSELAKYNPLVKVPCLVANSQSLFDSDVICDYLLSTTDNLIALAEKDWPGKTLYACANGILDVAVDRRKETALRDDAQQSAFWLARYQQAIEQALAFAEKNIEYPAESNQHSPNLAELTLAIALEYLDFRHPDINWRSSHAMLEKWHQQLADRPSLVATRAL